MVKRNQTTWNNQSDCSIQQKGFCGHLFDHSHVAYIFHSYLRTKNSCINTTMATLCGQSYNGSTIVYYNSRLVNYAWKLFKRLAIDVRNQIWTLTPKWSYLLEYEYNGSIDALIVIIIMISTFDNDHWEFLSMHE